MPATSLLVFRRAACVLACAMPVSAAQAEDFEWTGQGSNEQWGNPDNWNQSSAPDTDEDTSIFQSGPQGAVFNVVLVESVEVRLLQIEDFNTNFFGVLTDVTTTITGFNASTLTTNGIVLDAEQTLTDTGVATLELVDLTVFAGNITTGEDPIIVDPHDPGIHNLILDNTVLVRTVNSDFTPDNLNLVLANGAVFRRGSDFRVEFIPGANSSLTFAAGGILDFDTTTAMDTLFLNGGGHIYRDFSSTGNIILDGATTGAVFGDPDGTATRSADLSGTISGTGGVVVANENYTVSLLGSNTFTGGIYLFRGTVSVGAGSNLGGLSNFLQFSGGTLHIYDPLTIAIDADILEGTLDTDGHDVTYTGDWNDIDGLDPGSFTKTGLGTLTLNNNGSGYTGTLIVDQGTVVSGNGDTFSNQTAVTINTTATLRFEQAENFDGLNGTGTADINGQTVRLGYGNNAHDFAGQLTGTGQLVVTGPGTQRFSGDNTGFTGSFAVNGGTLAFGTTQSASGDINVADGADLVFDPDAGTLSFTHLLTGDGDVNKQGSGTLHITSDQSAFAGRWNVLAGTMTLDGTAGGISVYVGDGATVDGNGTVSGLLYADAGGTIAPGSSPGVLSADRFIMEPGSTLEIEIGGDTRGTDYDALIINDSATLAGTLELSRTGSNVTAGQSFDILDAGTLTGTFDDIDLASLFFFLRWDLTDLYTTGTVAIVSTGDANNDGTVGVEDLDLVLANWGAGTNTRGLGPLPGDVTGDFAVDQADLQAILDHWGTTPPPAGTPIPEPGTLALLAAAGLVTTRRRRR